MFGHVFICYSRNDEDFVIKLATNLKHEGVPIWLDQWDIPFGANWSRTIENALKKCTCLLIILSPSSVESDEVQSEWLSALDKNKVVIPILYKKCEIPFRLKPIKYIDIMSRSPEDKESIERILNVLRILDIAILEPGAQPEHLLEKRQNCFSHDHNIPNIFKESHKSQSAPRIALVGTHGSGKTSLLNALFELDNLVILCNVDMTDCVIRVEFPGGLVLYETPAIQGENDCENITRMFLGLKQDDEFRQISKVPIISKLGSKRKELSSKDITNDSTLDIILFVFDVSYIPLRIQRKSLRAFYMELKQVFEGHIVVAGTHSDRLEDLTEREKDALITAWSAIFDNQMIPVSVNTGEGLDDLVASIFSTMPARLNSVSLQQALRTEHRLNRISFIIIEVSKLLSSIGLMTDDMPNEIETSSIMIFAMIFSYYSEYKNIWYKYKFKTYHKIGIAGLKELIPDIYELIYALENHNTPFLSHESVRQIIQSYESSLWKSIAKNESTKLALIIRDILIYLFK
ncbi:MAG: TIR domain-containing protein [Methanothrix sp.]|nr:TIR domain-containing protein [Methanothrix sp.]